GMAGTAIRAGAPAAVAADSEGSAAAFTIDALFRAPANASAQISVDGAPMASMSPSVDAERERAEVGRLLARGLTDGAWKAEDKSYVAGLIANRTGLSQAEAETRIDTVLAQAKATADAARKLGIVVGFLMAAALMVAAAAATWAATLGGRHRDRHT